MSPHSLELHDEDVQIAGQSGESSSVITNGEVVWVWDVARVNYMMVFGDKTSQAYLKMLNVLTDSVCTCL